MGDEDTDFKPAGDSGPNTREILRFDVIPATSADAPLRITQDGSYGRQRPTACSPGPYEDSIGTESAATHVNRGLRLPTAA